MEKRWGIQARHMADTFNSSAWLQECAITLPGLASKSLWVVRSDGQKRRGRADLLPGAWERSIWVTRHEFSRRISSDVSMQKHAQSTGIRC